MGRQRGLKAVLTVEFGREFLGRFVAEGIADDDEGSAVVALLQSGSHVAVVKAVLVRPSRTSFHRSGPIVTSRPRMSLVNRLAVAGLRA